MATMKVKASDGTVSTILLGGANGLSVWMTELGYEGNSTIPVAAIQKVSNRQIQSGDILIFSSGHVCIIQTVTNSEITLKEEVMSLCDIDDNALDEMLIDLLGDVRHYNEFVTALRSEGSNPAFIDLGYLEAVNGKTVSDFSFEIKFRVDDVNTATVFNGCSVFGSCLATSEGEYGLRFENSNLNARASFGYYESGITGWISKIGTGEVYTAKFAFQEIVIKDKNDNVYYQLSDSSNWNANALFQSYKRLYLFARSVGINNTPDNNGGTKSIYYFKIYDKNGEIVNDFRPYVNTRGVACMKDIINDKEYPATRGTLVVEMGGE